MGKRVFIVLAAALLLVACKNEQNPPSVGGISYNNYFFRLANSTTQAKFSYSFSSNEEEVVKEFFVLPGESEIWHLAKISDYTGIDVSDKIILHLAAYDINTGTRVDLGSKTFFGSTSLMNPQVPPLTIPSIKYAEIWECRQRKLTFFCGIFAAWMRATEEGQAFLTRTDEYKDILA